MLLLTGCAEGGKRLQPGGVVGSTPDGARKPGMRAGKAGAEAEVMCRVEAHARYAAGVVHELRGEVPEAETNYLASVRADPAHEGLVIQLAHRLLQEKQVTNAIELLTRSAERKDSTGVIHGWLGLALIQAGQTNEAQSAYKCAVERSPHLFMGYHGLAQIQFQAGRPAEAMKVMERAAEASAAPSGLLLDVAEFVAAAERGKLLEPGEGKRRALDLLRRVADAGSSEPILLQRMAEVYKQLGELGRAAEYYQELLNKHGGANPGLRSALRMQLVRLHVASGDHAKASTMLREILDEAPTNPQGYLLLGALATESKDYPEAAAAYEKAILLSPDLEPAYYDLAGIQVALSQAEKALATLEEARARFGRNFQIDFITAVAQRALKQYREALASFAAAEVAAQAADPSRLNHVFYFQVGATHERLAEALAGEGAKSEADRSYAESERAFRRCLELSPDNAEALNYLGYMWAERGVHLEEARGLIERALKLEPDNSAYLDSLAWVLFRQAKPSEALPHMQKAMRLSEQEAAAGSPEEPDATMLDHLGDILAALNRWPEAREAWEKAVKVQPTDEHLQRKLKDARDRPSVP